MLVRRHHCRQCGYVVCSKCSSNRKFLDSSRTGTAKRICDTCHKKDQGIFEETTLPPVNIDEQLDSATAVLARLGKGGSSDGAAAVTPMQELKDDSSPAMSQIPTKLPPRASTRDLVAISNSVETSEAVQALKDHAFEGKWKFLFHFTSVEMVNEAPKLTGALNEFRSAAASKGKGKLSKDGYVRAGSRVTVGCNLKPKGGAYFQGECPTFGQFGQDGKITGSTQRINGRVTITLQMINRIRDGGSSSTITTSFNLTGTLNKEGVLTGSFTACEISKTANSFAGAFRAYRDDNDEKNEREGRQEAISASKKVHEVDSDSDSDSESDDE